MKRVAKYITDQKDINYLVNLTEYDTLKTSFIMEMFGEFNGKRRFNTFDTFTVPKDSYGPIGKRNKKPFRTTIGLWIYNKCFIEQDLFDIIKYNSSPLTKKRSGEINDAISYAVMEDRLELNKLKRYVMKTQKYQPYVHILTPNYTMAMLLVTKDIERKKAELIKKYKKEIDAKDPMIADMIEKELLAYAQDILGDDPSMDMFNSGARGSIGNNFKNLFVMRGAVKDPDPNKGYNIITSSFMTGCKKEEYGDLANSLAAGPYARANKTEIGGYWEKLLFSMAQHLAIVSDDCKTKNYFETTLDKDLAREMMYSYMIEGNKLVELTSQNIKDYIGKKVKFRFSSRCEEPNGFCAKCAGNMFGRLGIKNIGVALPQLASKLKVTSMKSFHDSIVKYTEMDLDKIFK